MKYPNCIQTAPVYPIPLVGLLVFLATVVFPNPCAPYECASTVTAQTKVPEAQLKLKVRVVEWQRCTYTSPDAKQSCVGMDLVRFLMSDGTIQGPYILLQTPPGYTHDPAKWIVAGEFIP